MFFSSLSICQNKKGSKLPPVQFDNHKDVEIALNQNILGFLNFQEHTQAGLINKKFSFLSRSSLISIHCRRAEKIIKIIEKHLPSSFQTDLEEKKTLIKKLKMELKASNLPSLKELTIKLGYLKNDLAEYLTFFLEKTPSKKIQAPFFLNFQNSFYFLNQNLLEATHLFFDAKKQIENSDSNSQLSSLIRKNCKQLEETGYPKLSMKVCSLYKSGMTKKTLIINFFNRKHQDWPFEEISKLTLKSIEEIPHEPTKRDIFNSIFNEKSLKNNENKLIKIIEVIPKNKQFAIEQCFKDLINIYTSKNNQVSIETRFNNLIDIFKTNQIAIESLFKVLINFYNSTNNQSAIEHCFKNLINSYISNNSIENALSFSKNFSLYLKEQKTLNLIEDLTNFFLKSNQFKAILPLIDNPERSILQIEILNKMLSFFEEPSRIQSIFKDKKLLEFVLTNFRIDDLIYYKKNPYKVTIVSQMTKAAVQLLKDAHWEQCIQMISLTNPHKYPSATSPTIHLVFAFYDPLKEKTQVNLSDPNISKFIIVFFEKLIKDYMKAWQTHKEVDFYALVNQVNASLKPQFPTINTQPILDVFNSEKEETTNHKTRKRNREDTLDVTQAPSSKTQKTTHNKD